MQIEVVTMTPERAFQILTEQNTNNRRMRPTVVQRYAQAIRAGQWKLTQQGVAIGSNGVLLDGQHRLAAIVEAEQAVQVALATDCDPSIFSVLDTGTARLAADVLQMRGMHNATAAAAGLKLYILNERHPDNVWTGNQLRLPTHADIDALFEKRRDEVDFVAGLSVSTHSGCRQAYKSSTVAFGLLVLDAGHQREALTDFCTSLGSGVGLPSTSPILRLRAALTNGVMQGRAKRSNAAQALLAALIKAFNYENEGAELKLFKLPQIPPMPTVNPA
jgi:hypothetical protein